jgi:hypothetical protein
MCFCCGHLVKPTWRRHFRLPPFAKNAKDGAPHRVGYASEIKSLGHPPRSKAWATRHIVLVELGRVDHDGVASSLKLSSAFGRSRYSVCFDIDVVSTMSQVSKKIFAFVCDLQHFAGMLNKKLRVVQIARPLIERIMFVCLWLICNRLVIKLLSLSNREQSFAIQFIEQ